MRPTLFAVLYFMACGYAIAKTGLDEQLWYKAVKLHDEWVRHVLEISRKELT